VSNPGAYFDVNVVGTRRILEAMRNAGVKSLVFSSTCAVYGEPQTVSLVEPMPCRPVDPYGASKLACEWLMNGFSTAHCIRSVPLRYFNAVDADPDGEIGEHHDPETHLVPLVIETTLGRRPSVQVCGTN
jgi:UDP-glucose 4-epimerase